MWKTAFIIGEENVSTMKTEEYINHFPEIKIEFENRDKNKINQQWKGRNNQYTMGKEIRNFIPQYGRNYRNFERE